jgi:L-lactate dehydrogenase (cytochrome)
MAIACTADFHAAALRRLPRFLADYIDGGAYAELTLARNVDDLAEIALRQRVLVDVSTLDLSTCLFGRDMAMPFGLGPVGLAGMYARRGEAQAARAASARGIPACLSSVSVCGIEEFAGASTAPVWFQLYVIRDRGYMIELHARAKAAGASALFFTVDLPTPGARYRDVHSGLAGPHAGWKRAWQTLTHPRWAWDVGLRGRPHSLGNFLPVVEGRAGLGDYVGWIGRNFDPACAWADIGWIRAHWDGPLIVKGILDADDAKRAADAGADGIVVSNHGGRQLDGVPSTARALPPIAAAVGERLTVLADGGVRSGLDVVRMLALGAKGVLLGRAWAWALAAGGEAGVAQLVDILEAEMRVAMMLTGVTRIDQIGPEILTRP